MKYIEKSVEDEHTGADVKYHEITGYSVNIRDNNSNVTVASYISKKTREAGKDPIGTPVVLTLNLAPPDNENPLDWFYNQLIQPLPADYTSPTETYYGYVDPYKFSGGKIKELTQPA